MSEIEKRGYHMGQLFRVEYGKPEVYNDAEKWRRRVIPDGSLVRLVFDDGDCVPAVDLLIPAGEAVDEAPPETDALTVVYGEYLISKVARGHIVPGTEGTTQTPARRVSTGVHPDKKYYWLSLGELVPLEDDSE